MDYCFHFKLFNFRSGQTVYGYCYMNEIILCNFILPLKMGTYELLVIWLTLGGIIIEDDFSMGTDVLVAFNVDDSKKHSQFISDNIYRVYEKLSPFKFKVTVTCCSDLTAVIALKH